ncbi:MAG: ATP-dependent sacrificial sulfur transferase LarE, partial [Pseudomonadota bacterium]
PDNRCYFCKSHLITRLVQVADEHGLRYVVEGTNTSDLLGHRPGYRAKQKFDRVVTPLIEAGFNKEDVRMFARELGLPNALKPAAACLASRVPTGWQLTSLLMGKIDDAEDLLRDIGVNQVRVRHHGDIARIEVDEDDMDLCIKHKDSIVSKLKELGWKFITLDLIGYRTGGTRG